MELKLLDMQVYYYYSLLLIVPYGIETSLFLALRHSIHLLIVPYGIETVERAIGKYVPEYF